MAKSITAFLLSIMLIAGLAYTAVYGVQAGDYILPRVFDEEHGIRKGLDLVGGSVITYEAQGASGDQLAEGMPVAVTMLRERLNNLGYYEATLVQLGDRRIQIEIPAISNPEEAVQKIGSTAELEFMDPEGNTVLTGRDVASARPVTIDGKFKVELTFKPEAVRTFYDVTNAISQREEGDRYLAIVLDDVVQSAPRVNSAISSETCVIESDTFTADEVTWLSNIISSGALPFALKDVELRSVGPQLGERALETSLYAGGIGLLIVMAFMIFIYRLPGFISSIVLIGYVAVVGLILSGVRINLSLPGIAGVILSIGMAVDANVVIFERIKEELRGGKSVRASIESGFTRAFRAILDANVTTIIAAGVLYYFGSGPIKGFAITLFVGILVSMFTAIIVTRFLLRRLDGLNIKNHWIYGA